jgi:TfoX/Sxy family transcriptional regulator of competence genes
VTAGLMKNSYSEIAEFYSRKTGVEHGRMFGSEGLKIGGKVFAMQVKGRLVVKLPAKRVSELAGTAGLRLFDPGHGRAMKEWMEIDAEAGIEWTGLAQESFDYVRKQSRKD